MPASRPFLKHRPWLALLLLAGGSGCVEPVPQDGSTGDGGAQASSAASVVERTQEQGQSSPQDQSSDAPSSSASTSQAPTTSSPADSTTPEPGESTAAPRCEDKGADYFCARRPDPDWQGPVALLQASSAEALASCEPHASEVKKMRERPKSSYAELESPFFRGCAIAREGSCEKGRICTIKGIGVTCIYRKDEHECPFFFSVRRYIMESSPASASEDKGSILTVCCQSGKGEESRVPAMLSDQTRATPY